MTQNEQATEHVYKHEIITAAPGWTDCPIRIKRNGRERCYGHVKKFRGNFEHSMRNLRRLMPFIWQDVWAVKTEPVMFDCSGTRKFKTDHVFNDAEATEIQIQKILAFEKEHLTIHTDKKED